MREKPVDMTRRRALLGAAATIASIPLAGLMISRQAQAADLPHVSEQDPTAQALSYHQDATQAPRVDRAGTPAGDQFCHNCMFVQAQSGEWRPCQIFPGKDVHETGWCSSWTLRQG